MNLQAFVPFVTYPEANADVCAMHAVSLAASLNAGLHAVAVNADIPDVSNALSTFLLDTPTMIRETEAASRQRGEHLLTIVKEKAEAAGLDVTTAAIAAPLATLAESAATWARYFDLCLVGWEAGNPTSRTTAEAVVFGSGRPTILLPELSDIATFEHVAVAWDGSRVAARAVADARPFLQRASRITVITVLDEKPLKDKNVGVRLAEVLRERGLETTVAPVKAQDCPIAQTLQQTAIEKGARLLVMGGYGHSRIRDFVLGGATAGVLSDLLMPVLLSH